MPFTATVHPILIASPTDGTAERDAAEWAIRRGNSLHSQRERVVLLRGRWEATLRGLMPERAQHALVDPRIFIRVQESRSFVPELEPQYVPPAQHYTRCGAPQT